MIAIDFGGHLVTGQRLTGSEGGRNFTQAFVWNVRDCLLMREQHSARIPERKTGDPETGIGGFRWQLNPDKVGRSNKRSRTEP